MTKRIFLFFLFLNSFIAAENLPTVSIIIPVHVSHVHKLNNLLMSYANQTLLPEEVVISASSLTPETLDYLEELKQNTWPFELIILTSRDQHLAGENRNLACDVASKELIICQDADDFPHPQRVEVIKYLYQKYGFDHLMHLRFHSKDPISIYDVYNTLNSVHYSLDELQIHFVENYADIYSPNYLFQKRVHPHGGSPSFPRKVFEKVQWRKDLKISEDHDFNRKVYRLFHKKIIALAKIYYYCQGESSAKNSRKKTIKDNHE